MANETALSTIQSRLPDIYEGALMYAMESFVMPSIVFNPTPRTSYEPRHVYEYAGGSVWKNIAETDDLDNTRQQFTDSLLSTLTPQTAGGQYVVTDRRMNYDPQDVMADLTRHIGYSMGKQWEQDLTGLFDDLTRGTIYCGTGTTAGTINWRKIYAARGLLAGASVPGPYNLVLHEFQWLELATAANIAASSVSHSMMIRDEIQSRYYVGSLGDMNIFVVGSDGLSIPTGGTVFNGMFAREALAFDPRSALRLELERNASKMLTEVNFTMDYATGVWRKNWGVAIKALAETPT